MITCLCGSVEHEKMVAEAIFKDIEKAVKKEWGVLIHNIDGKVVATDEYWNLRKKWCEK